MRPLQKTIHDTLGADAWNRMVRDVRSKTPIQSDDHLVGHTVHGVIRETVPAGPTSRPAAAATGMVFRGLYAVDLQYRSQNVVEFAPSGGSAGMYICLDDATPIGTAPATGAPYWVQWKYPSPGAWGA